MRLVRSPGARFGRAGIVSSPLVARFVGAGGRVGVIEVVCVPLDGLARLARGFADAVTRRLSAFAIPGRFRRRRLVGMRIGGRLRFGWQRCPTPVRCRVRVRPEGRRSGRDTLRQGSGDLRPAIGSDGFGRGRPGNPRRRWQQPPARASGWPDGVITAYGSRSAAHAHTGQNDHQRCRKNAERSRRRPPVARGRAALGVSPGNAPTACHLIHSR